MISLPFLLPFMYLFLSCFASSSTCGAFLMTTLQSHFFQVTGWPPLPFLFCSWSLWSSLHVLGCLSARVGFHLSCSYCSCNLMDQASALPICDFPIFAINSDNQFCTNYPAGSTHSQELTLFLRPLSFLSLPYRWAQTCCSCKHINSDSQPQVPGLPGIQKR